MALNKTQVDRVKFKLKRDGFITRNECLNQYISRLSAIILILKNQGWEFAAGKVKGDYKYTVIKAGN